MHYIIYRYRAGFSSLPSSHKWSKVNLKQQKSDPENFPCIGGFSSGINLAEAAPLAAEPDPPPPLPDSAYGEGRARVGVWGWKGEEELWQSEVPLHLILCSYKVLQLWI